MPQLCMVSTGKSSSKAGNYHDSSHNSQLAFNKGSWTHSPPVTFPSWTIEIGRCGEQNSECCRWTRCCRVSGLRHIYVMFLNERSTKLARRKWDKAAVCFSCFFRTSNFWQDISAVRGREGSSSESFGSSWSGMQLLAHCFPPSPQSYFICHLSSRTSSHSTQLVDLLVLLTGRNIVRTVPTKIWKTNSAAGTYLPLSWKRRISCQGAVRVLRWGPVCVMLRRCYWPKLLQTEQL